MRLVVIAILSLAAPVASAFYVAGPWAPTPEEAIVRPGAFVTSPSACTIGFLYTNAAGDRFATTAGHCVHAVGERVHVEGVPIGAVAWRHGDEDVNGKPDLALVKLDATATAHPSVRSWGGPCPSTREPYVGDDVGLFGNGAGTGETFGGPGAVKNTRSAVVTYVDAQRFGTDAVIAEGDSGAPVVHKATRAAVGWVEQYGPYAPQTGPRVPWVSATLAAAGVSVTMAYDPLC